MHRNRDLYWFFWFGVFFMFYKSGTTEVGLTGSSRQHTSSTAHFTPPSKSRGAAQAFQQNSQHNFSHYRKATYFPTSLQKILSECFRRRRIPNRADLRLNISQMISSAELKVLESMATACCELYIPAGSNTTLTCSASVFAPSLWVRWL